MASQPQIFHSSWNTSGSTSIVLIHGAFVSSTWWDLVIPHLPTEYHIVAPDLPGHGQSSQQKFSIQAAADAIAQLIREKATDGQAHVVGHSLGARVAIQLACAHPDLVSSVFVSGYGVLPQNAFTPYIPAVVWATQRLENLIPRPVIRWAMDGTDIPRADTSLSTLERCRDVMTPEIEVGWPSPWAARTLIAVAAKGGIVPSGDSREVALRLLQIGRQGNRETVAYLHPDMRHPWNRQSPRLFADTAVAWIEGGDIPDGFEKLECPEETAIN
ncbi:Alpha/Beta hydrolase protein [Aspergillus varians]